MSAPNFNTPVSVAELASHRLWHLLCKARYFDLQSRPCELPPEEEASAWVDFCERHKLDPTAEFPIPAEYSGCTPQQLREAVAREQRIAKWKEKEFGALVQVYFDRHRPQLDRLVYSLLRVQDSGVARELWLRIHEGETTFASLAPNYGGGMEKFTGGVIGPVAAGTLHPILAEQLGSAPEGTLLRPFQVGEWHLVTRLEKRIPAVLDSQLKNAILDELATKSMEGNG